MTGSADVFRYMSYVRQRWRVVAASGLVALALAFGVSTALPRQYTATARIVIEPPAGSDPRTTLAVSPIYLESLRTYETFAASDSLFQKAAERFRLREMLGRLPIEGLKKRVLKVGLVRNTRILEISATLPVAATAQALAQFEAEQTVALNQSLVTHSGNEQLEALERQAREAQSQLDRSDRQWSGLVSNEPVEDLQNEIFQAGQLRAGLEEWMANLSLDLTDSANPKESGNTNARLQELRRQLEMLNRDVAEKERRLAGRVARKDRLEAQRKEDEAAVAAVEQRVREARNDLGSRGERLSIIDPGVVPERPSSPNAPLNVSLALLLGVLLPLAYLAIDLGYQRQRDGARIPVRREPAWARDE